MGLGENVKYAVKRYPTLLLQKGKARGRAAPPAVAARRSGPTLGGSALSAACAATLTLATRAQTLFHWGFIPAIIIIGMRTEPRPSWAQLLGPM